MAAIGGPSTASLEPELVAVETEFGVGRLHRYWSGTSRRGVLALGHGAGGGVDSRDLHAIARHLPSVGIDVVLVEQPWVVAGKRVAPAPTRLDAAWVPLVAAIDCGEKPLIVGGRSAGARVACRTAGICGAVGVIALAFPLHPPGRPERSRVGELVAVGAPVGVIQGTRDPFGTAVEMKVELRRKRGVRVTAIDDADHSFNVALTADSTTDRALRQIITAVKRESARMLGC